MNISLCIQCIVGCESSSTLFSDCPLPSTMRDMLLTPVVRWIHLLVVQPVYALPDSFIPGGGVYGPCDFRWGQLHFDCIPVYIGYVIKFLLVFASGALLLGVILSGYKFAIGSVTAAGKEEGKKQLLGTIVGFCVAVLSFLLVDTIIEALT